MKNPPAERAGAPLPIDPDLLEARTLYLRKLELERELRQVEAQLSEALCGSGGTRKSRKDGLSPSARSALFADLRRTAR